MGMFLDGILINDMFLLHVLPGISMTLTLLYYRFILHGVWDVSLKIRPLKSFDPNANIITRLSKWLKSKFKRGKQTVSNVSDVEAPARLQSLTS